MTDSKIDRHKRNRHKKNPIYDWSIDVILFALLSQLTLFIDFRKEYNGVLATSINYGVSQQPITDINQLMPKLCQNQSVICEGVFCIPGIRKCVCDLRMPVQFGRFCLRQLDIETKCFVTSQCNHTVKDAVCIDINSNSILDSESSKFKLDQWQHLNDLRQSQSALPKDVPRQPIYITTTTTETPSQPMFLVEGNFDSFTFEAQDHVIMAHARNSPYEINYNTQELLLQNHTRRRTNNSDRSTIQGSNPVQPLVVNPNKDTQLARTSVIDFSAPTTTSTSSSAPIVGESTSTRSTLENLGGLSARSTTEASMSPEDNGGSRPKNYTYEQKPPSDLSSRKKMIVKIPNWPPGICSCPFGFMFDSMLRKCLALSLAESHCQVDTDCKQISASHCSMATKKCECDEPLQWDQKELACLTPKPSPTTESPSSKRETSFMNSIVPPLLLARLLPDQTTLLLIFVVLIILGTLIILKITVSCFSSSNSALISPKTKKKKSQSSNLPPRSPYATLRRPDHKPSSQLSNFTQATRGRILNYDFEQECAEGDGDTLKRAQTSSQKSIQDNCEHSGTIRSTKEVKETQPDVTDQLMDLNDNISVGQLESESKSDNSVLNIPAPPPNQQPPYMLKSAMKGQGSAIAAAAAAVANKRMQLAQKKNLEQQSMGGKIANGSPVFL